MRTPEHLLKFQRSPRVVNRIGPPSGIIPQEGPAKMAQAYWYHAVGRMRSL